MCYHCDTCNSSVDAVLSKGSAHDAVCSYAAIALSLALLLHNMTYILSVNIRIAGYKNAVTYHLSRNNLLSFFSSCP